MTPVKPSLDQSFIERQRKRLTELRDSLASVNAFKRAEEESDNEQLRGSAVEYEEDAQRLTTLELDTNLVARNAQRLAQINRALEKIAEGSYGRSDASDEPIPVERLEAAPEAIYTLAEQEALEAPRPTSR
jgi:RNA polymerase-binding transcription factor